MVAPFLRATVCVPAKHTKWRDCASYRQFELYGRNFASRSANSGVRTAQSVETKIAVTGTHLLLNLFLSRLRGSVVESIESVAESTESVAEFISEFIGRSVSESTAEFVVARSTAKSTESVANWQQI